MLQSLRTFDFTVLVGMVNFSLPPVKSEINQQINLTNVKIASKKFIIAQNISKNGLPCQFF